MEEGQRLLEMEEVLGRRVMGQGRAIKAVSGAIRAAKAGLKDPRRPVGVFLFLGPTGTGKTELAKALAEFLFGDERRLIRIDMSEYSEKHSVAKLIGSPPGYVGHEEGGQLTDKVRTNPYSVVLFDEIEKAHPEVFDLFLQVFDDGQLTDARGRRASFAEAVVILTSNLGSPPAKAGAGHPMGVAVEGSGLHEETVMDDRGIGVSPFGHGAVTVPYPPAATQPRLADETSPALGEAYEQRFREAVARALRPELLNRIQHMVFFYPLDEAAVRRIIDKILDGVRGRLRERDITLELAESAYGLLMKKGFDPDFGAREMERAVERLLVQPLGRALLEGRFLGGATVRVHARGEALALEDARPPNPHRD
jgi:ATP-dependent Clp protease ATP-binding subunit ClpC